MAIVSARLAPRTVLAWTCGRINRRLPSHPRQIACSGILPAVMLGETRDRTPAPAPPTRVCPDALHVAVMARTDHVDDTGSGRRKKKPRTLNAGPEPFRCPETSQTCPRWDSNPHCLDTFSASTGVRSSTLSYCLTADYEIERP